ncbi:hypothetical protein LCGC14_2132820 [marine sediment metagenome]|uniref:Replication protein n=1 Tax=marine sediment metagenome TaxID=412755 RepID=A0A0F9E0V0_9ZZZZ
MTTQELLTPPPELGFQVTFIAPTLPLPPADDPPAAPSLVLHRVTHEVPSPTYCPTARWVKATCDEHDNIRWMSRPCKRRFCSLCGVRRRKKIAWRIALGVELLAGKEGAGWFVGTWDHDIDKAVAVKTVTRFVAWVRRRLRRNIQYAVTWELTEAGRLHVNVVMAPWRYISQRGLSHAWTRLAGGRVVWIKRVGAGIGQEAAKSRAKAAFYFAKFEQLVPTRKGASYSRGWPKLPVSDLPARVGRLHYVPEHRLESWESPPSLFMLPQQLALWTQTAELEWMGPTEPWCNCFALQLVLDDDLPPPDVPSS